jgi:hypothetical protein
LVIVLNDEEKMRLDADIILTDLGNDFTKIVEKVNAKNPELS